MPASVSRVSANQAGSDPPPPLLGVGVGVGVVVALTVSLALLLVVLPRGFLMTTA